MICPACKSEKYRSHPVQPVMYGGKNAISHYTCERCGVMFVRTEFDTIKNDNKNLCERLDVVVDHLRAQGCLKAMAATVEEAIEVLKK